MTLRHKARQCALQMLYEWEMAQRPPATIEENFWKSARGAKSTREFANQLFEGAAARAAESDKLLEKFSTNWSLHSSPRCLGIAFRRRASRRDP
jgi:transcription termination factor NusB